MQPLCVCLLPKAPRRSNAWGLFCISECASGVEDDSTRSWRASLGDGQRPPNGSFWHLGIEGLMAQVGQPLRYVFGQGELAPPMRNDKHRYRQYTTR